MVTVSPAASPSGSSSSRRSSGAERSGSIEPGQSYQTSRGCTDWCARASGHFHCCSSLFQRPSLAAAIVVDLQRCSAPICAGFFNCAALILIEHSLRRNGGIRGNRRIGNRDEQTFQRFVRLGRRNSSSRIKLTGLIGRLATAKGLARGCRHCSCVILQARFAGGRCRGRGTEQRQGCQRGQFS